MTQRTIITAILLLIASSFLTAQENTMNAPLSAKKMAAVKQNIINGLRSGNPGLMSSSMRLITEVRRRYPSEDLKKITAELQKVQRTSAEGVLRFKAYLTLSMCEVPEWFGSLPSLHSANDEEFFHEASATMQRQLLAVQSAL